jgi:hypothetical protein
MGDCPPKIKNDSATIVSDSIECYLPELDHAGRS